MQRPLRVIRQWLAGGLIALAGSCVAHAEMLVSVEDAAPNASSGNISDHTYWAASWTQSVATTSTQISAAVFYQPAAADYALNAFLLRAIGPDATSADVVATRSLVPPDVEAVDIFNYDSANNTVLFSGLDLSADTYFVVLALSGEWRWTAWLGAYEPYRTFATAPGFSLGPTYSYGGAFSSPVDPPWQAEFVKDDRQDDFLLFFEVTAQQVPEPGMPALVVIGLLAAVLGQRLSPTRRGASSALRDFSHQFAG